MSQLYSIYAKRKGFVLRGNFEAHTHRQAIEKWTEWVMKVNHELCDIEFDVTVLEIDDVTEEPITDPILCFVTIKRIPYPSIRYVGD